MTLMGNWRFHDGIAMPVMTDALDADGNKFHIPLDYCIEAVTYDFQMRGFVMIISHCSFPECQPGTIPPYIRLNNVCLRSLPFKMDDQCDQVVYAKGIDDPN